MRTTLCSIALPLALMASASAPPPKPSLTKGDAFYVSALLKYVSPKSNDSVTISVRVTPCFEPFTFQEKAQGKDLFLAADPRGLAFAFAEEWSERLHRTLDECVAAAKKGVPDVEAVEGPDSVGGRAYRIVRPEL